MKFWQSLCTEKNGKELYFDVSGDSVKRINCDSSEEIPAVAPSIRKTKAAWNLTIPESKTKASLDLLGSPRTEFLNTRNSPNVDVPNHDFVPVRHTRSEPPIGDQPLSDSIPSVKSKQPPPVPNRILQRGNSNSRVRRGNGRGPPRIHPDNIIQTPKRKHSSDESPRRDWNVSSPASQAKTPPHVITSKRTPQRPQASPIQNSLSKKPDITSNSPIVGRRNMSLPDERNEDLDLETFASKNILVSTSNSKRAPCQIVDSRFQARYRPLSSLINGTTSLMDLFLNDPEYANNSNQNIQKPPSASAYDTVVVDD